MRQLQLSLFLKLIQLKGILFRENRRNDNKIAQKGGHPPGQAVTATPSAVALTSNQENILCSRSTVQAVTCKPSQVSKTADTAVRRIETGCIGQTPQIFNYVAKRLVRNSIPTGAALFLPPLSWANRAWKRVSRTVRSDPLLYCPATGWASVWRSLPRPAGK